MTGGSTTRATQHFKAVHHIQSPKTEAEMSVKRKRDAEIDSLRASALYSRNPRRLLNLLLETVRIINNNLPLRLGEYDESRLKEALVVKEEMKAAVNASKVKETIIELCASTRKAIIDFFEDDRQAYPNLTIVADFWTCSDKFLELRKYLITRDWEFKSVLLGTRKFDPAYGERDGGIQQPFRAWLEHTLEGFELKMAYFFGSTSDAGSDVKYMLRSVLNLRWEWCMAHMAHATTRSSCGMNPGPSAASNPEMTELISRLTRTIYQVWTVEKTGNLFEELCKSTTTTKSTRLEGYSSSRLLGLTNAMERVLSKWPPLEAWYAERACQAIRAKKASPEFLLANHKTDVIHVLSVLKPLAVIKRMCQAELPNQVNVLMNLYKLRLEDLSPQCPVKHYKSTKTNPMWIAAGDLTELATKTWRLVNEALDERFFSRYYNDRKIAETSFVFEMQMKLHPIFKHSEKTLLRTIMLCCRDHGDEQNERSLRM